jgi:hypothetical protein
VGEDKHLISVNKNFSVVVVVGFLAVAAVLNKRYV